MWPDRSQRPRRWRHRLSRKVAGTLALVIGVAGIAAAVATTSSASNSTTLTVWDFQYLSGATAAVGTLTSVEAKLDKEFEASHPGVKIDHVGIPFSTLWTKLQAAIAAQSGPDVVSVFPAGIGFQRGLAPLENLLSPTQKKQIIGWQEAVAPDGHLHVLPFTAYGYIWEYNKKLVKKAGLNPNDPFTSWRQLVSACSKLNSAGIQPMGGGWADGGTPAWLIQVFQGQTLTPAQRREWTNWTIPFTAFRQAFENVGTLRNATCWGKTGTSGTLNDAYTQFIGGKSAIYLGLGTEFADLKKHLGANNVGVDVMPVGPGSKYPRYTDMGPLSGWGITSFSKNQKLAWQYVSFLENPAAQRQIWQQAGVIPNVRGVKVSSSYAPEQAALKAILDNPVDHTAALPWSTNMTTAEIRVLPQWLNGQISLDSVLQQIGAAYVKDRQTYFNR